MTALLEHRGPNDSGIVEHFSPGGDWIGLGNRRLAILDLSAAGHMPMTNDDGTLTITYNGEVYNFVQLRERLEAKDYRFKSQTDTEVVLKMYEEYGPECLNHFDGMFAFAIADRRRAQIFLARDHFGIKPLYYIQRGHRFAFASEIKSFLAIPDFEARILPEALEQYLTFLWVPDPLTIFDGVLKLPAGHCATLRRGDLYIEQYWDLKIPPANQAYAHTEESLVEAVRAELTHSVRRQMRSDVPVGAFLSAGLDSSSIVSIMSRLSAAAVRTYTIGFAPEYRVGENTLDDPSIPRSLAKKLGCQHHEIEVKPQIASLLPKLIYHMDEPTADPALAMAYLVCREARRDSTVLLSGAGGDEIFGGYRRYHLRHWHNLYQNIPRALRQSLIEPAINHLPVLQGSPLKGWVRLAKKMVRSAALEPRQSAVMNLMYMSPDLREELFVGKQRPLLDPAQPLLQHLDRVQDADFLHQLMYLDLKTFLPSLNLAYIDKMSMANSVEVRVPFLDRHLAEMLFTEVPPSLKVRRGLRGALKHILRRAMADLPKEVLNAPKAGFGAPIDHWLTHDLRDMTEDLLSATRIHDRGFFSSSVVQRLIEEHHSGKVDWSFQIWQLLTFEIWSQTFLDRADFPNMAHEEAALARHGTCATGIGAV